MTDLASLLGSGLDEIRQWCDDCLTDPAVTETFGALAPPDGATEVWGLADLRRVAARQDGREPGALDLQQGLLG